MGAVTVVGSFVLDHAWAVERFPRVGETTIALGFATAVGGKGFNQAVAALRLGARTRFIGAIGHDHLGEAGKQFARDEGLDCAWETHPTLPTAAASIMIDSGGANLIAVALGANGALSADFVRSALAAGEPPDVLLAQLEANLDATRAALTAARREGALTMLNPAPLNVRLDRSLLALADLLTPNEGEFQLLLALLFGIELAPDYFRSSDVLLNQWCRATGVATVVITLGAEGVFVSHDPDDLRGDARPFYRIAASPVATIDTTGAGDAFSGALAARLAEGRPDAFRDAVEFASRAAALSTEARGCAPSMPTAAQLKARFG